MKKILFSVYSYYILLLLVTIGCTEPYALQSLNNQKNLVIEATITNEFKKQKIKISRTRGLQESIITNEKNAIVFINDNLGNHYEFEEIDTEYLSKHAFQAMPHIEYKLHVITQDGKNYTSSKQKLTTVTDIQNITAIKSTKNGESGVKILVNSFDPTNTSKYYRYEYEETSKITSPKWTEYNTILLNSPRICPGNGTPGFETIGFETRQHESKTCYATKSSIDIILESTNNLNEDQILDYPIRFIKASDYTIAERYSIAVRQYVLTLEAFTYYNTLKKITEQNGSILSQVQPGLLLGNIRSDENPNEIVVGYFEVSSVSSKRIFFNFEEIFPNTQLPKYPYDCKEYVYDSMDFGTPDPRPFALYPCGNGGSGVMLRSIIRNKTLIYYRNSYPLFYMVKPQCGDCSTFSSNIKPLFWID